MNFIFFLVLTYLGVASLVDLKKKEVPDALSFSFLWIGLIYLIFLGISSFDFLFLYGIFYCSVFILANFLYYGNLFGGGDYKLMLALIPFILNFGLSFFFNFFLVASIYGFSWAILLFIKNHRKINIRKEINKEFFIFSFLAFSFFILFLIFSFRFVFSFFWLSLFVLFLPLIYLLIKLADQSLIKFKQTSKLEEGDLLANSIKIKNKIIKQGQLGKKEIELLSRFRKKVRIKEGIPFVPVFFFTYLITYFLRFPFF